MDTGAGVTTPAPHSATTPNGTAVNCEEGERGWIGAPPLLAFSSAQRYGLTEVPPLPKLQMFVSLLWKSFSAFTYERPALVEALTPPAL